MPKEKHTTEQSLSSHKEIEKELHESNLESTDTNVDEKVDIEKNIKENMPKDSLEDFDKVEETLIEKECDDSEYFLSEESEVIHKKISVHPLKRYFEKCREKINPLLENGRNKIKDFKQQLQKNSRLKFLVISLACFVILGILFQIIHHININRGETPKYVVDQFVSKLKGSMDNEDSSEKNLFSKGKRVQLYGPIVRIKDKIVYMKAEGCILEITMSSKKEISSVILGKQYKIEASISDVSAVDEALYFKRGVFLEPLPSSIRQ